MSDHPPRDWSATIAWLDENQEKIESIRRSFTAAGRPDLPMSMDDVGLVMVRLGYETMHEAAIWLGGKTGPRYDVYVSSGGSPEFFQADDWHELVDSLHGSLLQHGVTAVSIRNVMNRVLAVLDPEAGGEWTGRASLYGDDVSVKVIGPRRPSHD